MHLEELTLRNFRNWKTARFDFNPDIHVIFGDNAQGKTNLLEAIYYLSSLKTFRSVGPRELITFEEPAASVSGRIAGPRGQDELSVTITPESRKLRRNDKTPGGIEAYLSVFPVIRFIPDDILVLKGSGTPRRRMIDRSTFMLDPKHLSHCQSYQRALTQKNSLLRRGGADRLSLEVWNDQLIEFGSLVIRGRLDYLKRLNPILTEFFAEISGGAGEAHALYSNSIAKTESLSLASDLPSLFRQAIEKRTGEERARGFAVVGPHRDDLEMEIGGHSVRHFGSQGQHRMFALAWKIAEIVLWNREHGSYPVLLLDDVRSELDTHRVRYLFSFLNEIPAQIFVTSTDFRELSDELKRSHVSWKIEGGVGIQMPVLTEVSRTAI